MHGTGFFTCVIFLFKIRNLTEAAVELCRSILSPNKRDNELHREFVLVGSVVTLHPQRIRAASGRQRLFVKSDNRENEQSL